MDDSERRSAKRSRFDQTEAEPRKPSRFDRRSRSPPSRRSESARDRSPLSAPRATGSATPDAKSPVDPAAAAAAAAAKINAMLQARKGVQHIDVPPVKSTSSASKDGSTTPAANLNGEMYISDGDYIKDIEVNDLRNRYLLTKGATQKMIKDETGADVTTRGSYYPDKSMSTPTNPPLYLHITSTTKEGLDKAVAKIDEMMKQELPQLVDERRFRRRDQEQAPVERDELGRRKWPEERIPIDMESIPGFNLRAQVVGHGGAYVKHIQTETGCRVQIKGRGSGFMEISTGRESDDDMYLHVTGPDPAMVQKAKELCNDLLDNVREQYEEAKALPPRSYGRGYGGDRPHNNSYNHSGGYQGYNNSNSNQHYGSNSGYQTPTQVATQAVNSVASPTTATSTVNPDYSAQYAQYYASTGAADPYAAYGGYAAYAAYYAQWYAQQQAGAAVAAPASATPPPPPPAEAAPPPPPPPPPSTAPPPPPPGTGGYNSVPPPPGL